MELTQNEKIKILGFVTEFPKIAKDEKWISSYDTEADSLVIRSQRLSGSATKKYVNDEFAFYITPQTDVQGIFIEYFMSNFVAHHRDFKAVTKELKSNKKEDKEKPLVQLETKNFKKIVPELGSIIVDSLFKNLDTCNASR